MISKFKIGDHVSWNSEAGRVSGTIVRVHTRNFEVNGYTRHASAEAPQYEIKSSKTEHIAFHQGSRLTSHQARSILESDRPMPTISQCLPPEPFRAKLSDVNIA